MKLKNLLLTMSFLFLGSVLANLITNITINNLSDELSNLNSELIELEIQSDLTKYLYEEKYSIVNIDKISNDLNMRKLEIKVVNKNLTIPYKSEMDNEEPKTLGFFGR